ncbi:putative transcription factor interactor and regulator C3H-WRC/GRF family [Helianthus annuus]|nr:putative transcription factor interactor and regulator C3H-WRC/GRF family [Helianthus annuus]KAJ0769169.1 putative transcription factor interactor and regulator C3H-WRC/GRF family [Helianthus annuus]KAJ0774919.1 putative transcription factor interactor and regulator C3H-WRC/GRF family [Helianthus annuus]
MMQGVSSYFSIGQWQELEVQALIFRHMLTGSPIPPQLLHLLLNSNHNLNYPRSNFPPCKSLLCKPSLSLSKKTYITNYIHVLVYQTGGGYWGRGGMDPEPGRCKRTDGKKWRCSRDVVAGHKYCERHIHRGRNRSRKPVEIPTPAPIATAATPVNTTALCGGVKPYTMMGGGGSGGGGGGLSVHSNFFDHLHLNQRYNALP